jgi:hypothetical protein
VTVTDNGVYEVSAADKWGNRTTAQVRIDFIDRLAPVISFADTRAVNVAAGSSQSELADALREGVSARDEREGDVTPGITVDVSGVDLDTAGTYTATYAAEDSLGNRSERTRQVRVSKGAPMTIGGTVVWAEDTYATRAQTLSVGAPAGYALYWSQGKKTYGEMKYAAPLGAALNAANAGFYTILAQSAERDSYLVYVYVYY